MPAETIPVRADEKFDETRVSTYLRDRLPDADQPMTVEQFPGGAANLTYLLRFGETEYVLRRPPLGPVAPKAHDMRREYNVLSALYQEFPYAPRAFHFCDDPDIIGAPFLIMERRRGIVIRRDMPDAFQPFPDAARQMSAALVDRLADLHAVDYETIGLGALGRPDGFVQRQIEGWYGRWEKANVDDVPVFEDVYGWLQANIPPPNPPTLLHNDYKLDNVMFSRDDPSQVVGIFDWDMCTLGDPLVDLGTLLAYWTEKDDAPFYKGLLGMPEGDFLTRRELVEHYAARSGRDVLHIRFYHVLAMYRVVVIIAQIYIRYHRGQTQDERFASFGQMIPVIAQNAYDLALSS